MEPHSTNSPAVHRVVLPSGRAIEVLLFGEDTTEQRELQNCDQCHRDLVHPLDWSRVAPGRWRVSLHCPNCDIVEEEVFSEEALERFGEALDAGTDVLLADL